MGLNETPSGERKHIAFFGCRNAGKSSLLNAVTGQDMAIVSDVKGTTTDPVYKAMELLPAGPVVVIDTPGLDDEGELGEMRVKSAMKVLKKTDLAVIVIDAAAGFREEDALVLDWVQHDNIPYVIVYNKADIAQGTIPDSVMAVSAITGQGIFALKEKIAALLKTEEEARPIASDLVKGGDMVVLVVPIDKAAPKGRLILPQQQTIRDLLDHGIVPVVVRDTELESVLKRLGSEVKLVITDSQAFKKVGDIVPEEIPLTSFSILFSRYKGELKKQLEAVDTIDKLKDGDRILIAEGCTHHRQCGDIGTEKIPKMLSKYGKFEIDFTSGQTFSEDPGKYRLIIHCGGCMLNEKEMKSRIAMADEAGVPITNYGMVIAKMTGMLDRSIKPLGVK
ncbi:MAG: [FeFe] hydrogenase H-cluster maturation GTPase HydF [Lachnospiraceae bacterium]|nr:[FeFe] hydrogenase H-cluster maturation GTPase HydF [Lachnospiraceae bacterium]